MHVRVVNLPISLSVLYNYHWQTAAVFLSNVNALTVPTLDAFLGAALLRNMSAASSVSTATRSLEKFVAELT